MPEVNYDELECYDRLYYFIRDLAKETEARGLFPAPADWHKAVIAAALENLFRSMESEDDMPEALAIIEAAKEQARLICEGIPLRRLQDEWMRDRLGREPE